MPSLCRDEEEKKVLIGNSVIFFLGPSILKNYLKRSQTIKNRVEETIHWLRCLCLACRKPRFDPQHIYPESHRSEL